jgi:hypothetical protein
VNPAARRPARISGPAPTSGGQAGNQVCAAATGVRWLPPTPVNVSRTLATISAGLSELVGPASDQ